MKTILFDMYYGVGHTYSSLKLARILKERGHRVVYIGLENYCAPAIQQGFDFVNHNPMLVPSIELLKMQKKRSVLFENLNNVFSDSVIKEARQNIEAFKDIINKIAPDVVIVDEDHTAKFFFYKLLHIPTISVQTMPDKNQTVNIPPFTSYFCPKPNSLASAFIVSFLWTKKKIWIRALLLFRSFKYLGQDALGITKRLIKENGANFYDLVSYNSSFKFCVKNNPLLILSPVDFDFPRQDQTYVFRIGPLKDIGDSDGAVSPRFEVLRSKIAAWKENGKYFIVFCSLGTVTFAQEKRLNLFFKKMKQVALLNPNMQFIFSVSENFEIEDLYPVPGNLSVFAYLPQLELLRYCDLMITHGGMNSITECIFSEVPMLVYPLSFNWDQPGNSARVVYHKLGLRGKINIDSPRTISNKINRIKTDYRFYSDNIQQMKKKFDQRNNSTEVIDIIESIIEDNEK